MLWLKGSSRRLQKCVIARSPKSQYASEGYFAVVDGNFAGVVWFAQDSYYGEYEGHELNEDGSVNWSWTGTPQELVKIAKLDTDLMFPNMQRNKEDCDYELISYLYKGIIKWARKNKKFNRV